jgi:hypothetical protein
MFPGRTAEENATGGKELVHASTLDAADFPIWMLDRATN